VGHRRLKNQCSWEIILIFQSFGSLWIILESARRARSTYGISSRFGGHCGSFWVIACFTNTRVLCVLQTVVSNLKVELNWNFKFQLKFQLKLSIKLSTFNSTFNSTFKFLLKFQINFKVSIIQVPNQISNIVLFLNVQVSDQVSLQLSRRWFSIDFSNSTPDFVAPTPRSMPSGQDVVAATMKVNMDTWSIFRPNHTFPRGILLWIILWFLEF
jgi:hypothetical protein